MAWVWRYAWLPDASGDAVHERAAAPQTFPTQSDAETWLGENWRALRVEGVVSATLLNDERVVYGPMPLEV